MYTLLIMSKKGQFSYRKKCRRSHDSFLCVRLHLNVIPQYPSRYMKSLFSIWVPHQSPVCIYFSAYCVYVTTQYVLLPH